jgi:hypothetical protein
MNLSSLTVNLSFWTRRLQAGTCLAALVLLTACGGGGGGGGVSPPRFESTVLNGVAAVRDNESGIVWAARLDDASATVPAEQMPTARELLGLADLARSQLTGSFDALLQGDTKVQASGSVGGDGTRAWMVDFSDYRQGGLSDEGLGQQSYLRVLSRPKVAEPAISYSADTGIVTQGSLMWSACAVRLTNVGSQFPNCAGFGPRMSLQQAQLAANQFRLGGYGDWRLPTKQELQGLLSLGNVSGSLLPQAFNGDPLEPGEAPMYWTSSTITAAGVTRSWVVDFSVSPDWGGVELFFTDAAAMTRLVRTWR